MHPAHPWLMKKKIRGSVLPDHSGTVHVNEESEGLLQKGQWEAVAKP